MLLERLLERFKNKPIELVAQQEKSYKSFAAQNEKKINDIHQKRQKIINEKEGRES